MGVRDLSNMWKAGNAHFIAAEELLSSLPRPPGRPIFLVSAADAKSKSASKEFLAGFKTSVLSGSEIRSMWWERLQKEISSGSRPAADDERAKIGELIYVDGPSFPRIPSEWQELDQVLRMLRMWLELAKSQSNDTASSFQRAWEKDCRLIEKAWRDGLQLPAHVRSKLSADWPGMEFFDARPAAEAG
jgi:hypothetical protein